MPKVARDRGNERERRGGAIQNVDGFCDETRPPRIALTWSARHCLLVGSSVIAATTISDRLCRLATLRRETGERPRTAFVIHDSAGAVDWVEQAFPFGRPNERFPRESKAVPRVPP